MKQRTKNSFFSLLIVFFTINTHAQEKDTTLFKSVELDSVVIMNSPKVVRQKGTAIHVRVRNTIYEDMGNVFNMLENVPGIIRTAGGLEVRGRGKPIYVIDGREIKQEEVLNVLSSSEIESITIERSPSSAYSSKTGAVVFIKTRQYLKDLTYLRLNNILSKKRKWSETPSFDFKYKKGAYSTILTYMFSDDAYLNKESYFRDIYHSDYTFHSIMDREISGHYQSHKIYWTNEYWINKKSWMGLYYYFQKSNHKDNEIGSTTLEEEVYTTNKIVDIDNCIKSSIHSISLSYNFMKSSDNYLLFVNDLTFVNNNNGISSSEKNIETGYLSEILTGNEQRYTASSSSLRYAFIPFGIVKNQWGANYNYIHSSIYSTNNQISLLPDEYNNQAKFDEHNLVLWTELRKKWEKLNLTIGLRYEYTHRKTSSKVSNLEERTSVTQSYSNLFPKVSLSYDISDNLSIHTRYSRFIDHPNYNKINPGLVYKDSLSYEDGNVDVCSAIYDRISLDADWFDFSFSIGYTHVKNPIIEPAICLAQNTNITISHPVNLEKCFTWNPSISYNKSFKSLDLSLYADLTIPKTEYQYLGETINANKIQIGAQANCTYKINKHFSVYTMFEYAGKNNYLNTTQETINKWDVGFNAKLMKNRLSINFQIMDILHGANYNNLYDRYLNIKSGTSGTNDFRGVKLTMRYTIFNKQINNYSDRGNQNLINKMTL